MEKLPLGFKSGPTKILVIKGFPVSGNSVTNIPPFYILMIDSVMWFSEYLYAIHLKPSFFSGNQASKQDLLVVLISLTRSIDLEPFSLHIIWHIPIRFNQN